jgi:putative addiction module component (TIGR02574 family)
MDFSSTLAAIRSLSIDDRIRLAEAIWDDIAADQDSAELTDAQKCELERRLADDDANPDDVVPWEIVKAQARARSGG